MYAERFAGATDGLDVGCGRGEFLEVAHDAGIPARGIDQSGECVAICRSKGLQADRAELFSYLDSLADRLVNIFLAENVAVDWLIYLAQDEITTHFSQMKTQAFVDDPELLQSEGYEAHQQQQDNHGTVACSS